VARGTRPDTEVDRVMYLLKNVSTLRPTYQIRLLTYLAAERKRRLVIRVPKHCQPAKSLREFIAKNKKLIALEKV
jgi:hypothetical protein